MKTNTKKQQTKKLQSRPEQSGTDNTSQIDFARRRENRSLDTDSLLILLRKDHARFFELAEMVGKWVWIQFPEKQPREVTRVLSELGFHWNNARQVWQHPCGTIPEREEFDPRKRYGSQFVADQKAA